jgi:hypothetical protein
LAEAKACEVCEPVEWVAGAGGEEGLGEFFEGDEEEEDEGDTGDEGGEMRDGAWGERQVAKEAECAHEADVAEFVAVGDVVDEGPPMISFAAVGDGDDEEEEEDEGEGEGFEEVACAGAWVHFAN